MLSCATFLVSNCNNNKSGESPLTTKTRLKMERSNATGRTYVKGRPLSVDLRTSIVDEIVRNGRYINTGHFVGRFADVADKVKVARSCVENVWRHFFREQGEQGWCSGCAFASHAGLPPMWPGFDSRTQHQMWVEFAVGSHPCSKRLFSRYSGFPLSSKANISKFQQFKGTL